MIKFNNDELVYDFKIIGTGDELDSANNDDRTAQKRFVRCDFRIMNRRRELRNAISVVVNAIKCVQMAGKNLKGFVQRKKHGLGHVYATTSRKELERKRESFQRSPDSERV